MKALIIVLAAAALVSAGFATNPTREKIVDYVNSLNTTWKATVYERFAKHDFSKVQSLLGALPEKAEQKQPLKQVDLTGFTAPDNWDARTAFPACTEVISEIRDQSMCGSCWAFGAVSAATDRWCIATNGAQKPRLSEEDLLSCCSWSCGSGCNGGYPSAAWGWFKSTGVSTGGPYSATPDPAHCNNYFSEMCDHHTTGQYQPCGATKPTPKCVTTCNAGYPVSYAADKHKFKSSYSVGSKEAELQAELMAHGPIEVAFSVYADFESYKSGIYHHTTGSYLGGHAVRMIGWGVENGVKYWTIANSWNTDWGENGTFRILRGQGDECGIQSEGVAGLPDV
jgi:cathepsin B